MQGLLRRALLDGDFRSGGQARIDRAGRSRHVERDPVFFRHDRLSVRPDLVRGVAVRGDPVGAYEDEVDFAAAEEKSRGAVRDDGVFDSGLQELPYGEPSSLEPRPRLIAVAEEPSPLL